MRVPAGLLSVQISPMSMRIRSSNYCRFQTIIDVLRRKGVDPLVTHAGGLPLAVAYLIILRNPVNGRVERQTDRARVKSDKRPLAGEG